jgi:prepilin peptidase CpaA
MTDLAILLIFPGLMAYAAMCDLLTMTIPNRISLALIIGFGLLGLLTGMPLSEIAWHLGAGLLMLALGFALFSLGWIGGGDAKLAAATSLWFGFSALLDYLVWSAIFGGALTLLILQVRFFALPGFATQWSWLVHLHHPKTGIPYGIALAAGALAVFPKAPFWSLNAALM